MNGNPVMDDGIFTENYEIEQQHSYLALLVPVSNCVVSWLQNYWTDS